MSQQPITHDGPDRCYKLCRCSKCGVEATCTPSFDFYAKELGDPLVCESCFQAELSAKGMKFVNLTGPEMGKA